MTGPSTDQFKIKLVRETFNDSLIPMFWCDCSHFLMFNKAFATITGYEEEELHQIGFNDLCDTKNEFSKIEDIHGKGGEREAKIITWHLRKKNGSSAIFETRLTRILSEADEHFYYGVMRQMDEPDAKTEIFKDVISKLQDSLSVSRQGVWEWYGSMNQAALLDTHIGISDRDLQVVGFDAELFLSKVHPIDRPRVKINWERMTTSTEDLYIDEYRILNKAKEYIWVHSEGKVMERNSEGDPLRISGIIRNIEDQKKKEQLILKQTQKLVDYAFMNSHLLRGPAASILGLVDLLEEGYDSEKLSKLKEAALSLDQRIHEINHVVQENEANNANGIIDSYVQRVSLISQNSLQGLILKNTVEEISLKMDFDLNRDLDEFSSSDANLDTPQIVILDEESCPDIFEFLSNFQTTHKHIPVYILASQFDVKMIDNLNQHKCVHGIILKTDDHHGLLEFLKDLNK